MCIIKIEELVEVMCFGIRAIKRFVVKNVTDLNILNN